MFSTLVRKDIAEHGVVFMVCLVAFILVILVSAIMNISGPYSVSPIEVVRFSLITLIPLLAFIAGGRLLVDEYLGRTRLFVEALPVSRVALIVQKMLTGWIYLLLVASVGLCTAVYLGGPGDDFDLRSLVVISVKTATMVTLIWSIVFCFSMTGHLRVFFYLLLFLVVALLLWYPGLDQEILGPFRLMDNNIFSYEREIIPWRAIFESLMIAGLFLSGGLYLALANDGSIAEKLSKRLSRREFVILGIFCASLLVLFGTLLEREVSAPRVEFAGEKVMRNAAPPVSIMYLSDEYESDAQSLMQAVVPLLDGLQRSLGITEVPTIRFSMEPGLTLQDLKLESAGGVWIRGDFSQLSQFERSSWLAIAVHEVFQQLTSQRASVEEIHWILDGFSRWWTEKQVGNESSKFSLIAQALISFRQQAEDSRFFFEWQNLADQVGYPRAELMAYSAFVYLEESTSEQTVLDLAREFLTQPVSRSSIATVQRWLNATENRFEKIVGIPLPEFLERWEVWLEYTTRDEPLASMIAEIPRLQVDVATVTSEVPPVFSVKLTSSGNSSLGADARCFLYLRRIGVFDSEMIVKSEDRHELSCFDSGEQKVPGQFSRGDRVYLAVEVVTDNFEAPWRLYVDRIDLK